MKFNLPCATMQRWEDAQAAVHLVARASLGDPITRVAAYQNLLAIGTAFGSVRDASISFRATSWYIRGNCLQVSLWDMRTHSGPPVLSACADTPTTLASICARARPIRKLIARPFSPDRRIVGCSS